MPAFIVQFRTVVKKAGGRMSQPLKGGWDLGPLLRLAKVAINGAAQSVPGLSIALELVTEIANICEQVRSNKRAIKQLCDRCVKLMDTLQMACRSTRSSSTLEAAVASARDTLQKIRDRFLEWKAKNNFEVFKQNDTIKTEVEESHKEITSCVEEFQLFSVVNIGQWQEEFELNCKADHEEIIDQLSALGTRGKDILAVVESAAMDIRSIMSILQKSVSELPVGDVRRDGLQNGLRIILEESGELLPNIKLTSGEVKIERSKPLPVQRDFLYAEHYFGKCLGTTVVVKSLNRIHRDSSDAQKRFLRERKVWEDVWKQDRGRHTVPVYGFYTNPEDLCMYLIYPYYENGYATQYVKDKPNVRHMSVLLDIARGLAFLHRMDIMHGDMRGESVLIDRDGRALLAEFGLSKVVEDIEMEENKNGGMFPVSRPIWESNHWHAPEVFMSSAQCKASDIWSYGMTVLELLTHDKPYAGAHDYEVGRRVIGGQLPSRPTEEVVVQRGLTDRVWDYLTEELWRQNHLERPDIQNVLVFMNEC